MLKLSVGSESPDGSFLPEDYLAKKAERRTNLVAVTLFLVVLGAIAGAFFVTHREWKDVRHYHETLNVRYSQAAMEIEQVKTLEAQKAELLEKAELTMALIEKVPRSILLAELINRMPSQMTLLEMDVHAERKDQSVKRRRSAGKKPGKSLATRKSKNAAEDEEQESAVKAPKYDTRVVLVGVAPTHNLVAQYTAQLQTCELLRNIELKFSDKTVIKDRQMFKFRVECELDPSSDARELEPGANPRLATGLGDGGEEL